MNISGTNSDPAGNIQERRSAKKAHMWSFGGRVGGVAIFFVIFILSNCLTKSAAHAEEVIKIGGVGGALGTMKIMAAAFEKSHPGIKVVVLSSIGTKGALKAVPDGAIDIGLLGLSKRDEKFVSGATVTEYARTPFIFVSRGETGKKSLTVGELSRIFRGDIQRWPDGERVRTILRRPDDTDNIILKDFSPAIKTALDRALSQRGLVFAVTDQDNLDIIEKTPGAFGYTTLSQVISEKRRVKVFSLNGVVPGAKTLADGSYPLYKALCMLTKQSPSGKILKFVNFVMSGEGARILKENGNIIIINK